VDLYLTRNWDSAEVLVENFNAEDVRAPLSEPRVLMVLTS
jgi:hypothetical protein